MDRYDPYTDSFLRDTQYNILSTNLASLGTDCISRQAAIDAARMVIGDNRSISVCDAIKQLPTIQPKRGRWLYCEDSMADCVDGYRCDQCGFFVPWDYQHKNIDYIKDYYFCPKCGSYNGGDK